MMIALVTRVVRLHQYNDGLPAMLAKAARMLAKKIDCMVMAATDHFRLRSSAASKEKIKWIRYRVIIRFPPVTYAGILNPP